MSTVRDDVTLALQLADQADALTMDRFGALDLHDRHQTGPDAGDRRRPLRGDRAARHACRAPARRRDARRRVRRHNGFQRTAVGDRSDRRHQELRARRSGVGHADRAAARRRAGRRGGQRARAAAPLVGRRRARARSSRLPAAHRGASRCRRSPISSRPACRCPASPAGRSWACATASSTSPTPCGGYGATATSGPYCLVAEGAVDIAAEPEVSLWDLAPLDVSWCARPAARSPASTARTGRTAAAPSPPTGACIPPC